MRDNRPLSPHLSIHRIILTAVFSILHRITGIGLSIGSVLICIWITCIALGEHYYLIIQKILLSHLFSPVFFILIVGIFYHLCNGIRYLFWSLGYGLEIKIVYFTGYIVILMTIILTFAVWMAF